MKPFFQSSTVLTCSGLLLGLAGVASPLLTAQTPTKPQSTHLSVKSADRVPEPTLEAKTMMDDAEKVAARGHKEVFVKFSASWCAPCHLWDAVLSDPKVSPIVDKRFVFVELDPAENQGDPKHHETPGAQTYMAALGSEGISLPFLAVLQPSGSLIFNSIGYPDKPEELDAFFAKLHKAEPGISDADSGVIRQALIDHRKDRGSH